MSLGWVIGECEAKQGLGGRDDRINALKRSEVSVSPTPPTPPTPPAPVNLPVLIYQAAFGQFLSLLSSYGILNDEEKAEGEQIAQMGGLPKDPAKRREMKIRQYRREKELKQQIAVGHLD
jgi:hypothetical protein